MTKESRVYRRCKTRDGREFVVREAAVTDAEQLLANARAILAEPRWSVTELDGFCYYDEVLMVKWVKAPEN